MIPIAVVFLLGLLFVVTLFVPFDHVNLKWRTIRAMSKLSGPFSIPFFGLGLLMAVIRDSEMVSVLTYYYKKYPRILATYIVGMPLILLHQPDDLEILLGSATHIKKGFEYEILKSWLNEGLLLSTGEKWRHRRKLLTPAFHFRILEDNLQSLNKHARYLLRNILEQDGKPFAADQLVTLCTLDVICETAMGISLNTQDNQALEYVDAVKRLPSLVVDRIRKFWKRKNWLYYLTISGRKFHKSLTTLHNFTEKIIQERKLSYSTEIPRNNQNTESEELLLPKKRKAFLDSLLELDLKYPNLFSDLDIREEVDTFMFEGHDTTSVTLTFALYLLGLHPEIQEKTFEEQYNIFGDSDRAATRPDLNEMHYLEMVIKETLRLYPSVPYISRSIAEDLILPGNVVLPAGANVLVLPYFLHRDVRYFPDPEVFNPERFTIENCKTRHPYSYIPFSAGPRNCIGQKFAMMELKVVLSTIIRFVKIEPVTKPEDIKVFPFVILRSKDSVLIKCEARRMVK
uniref:Putative p450 enzyme n=1 Tax=Rhodnius prolixus TaxID=13249 RepID=R4FQF2_RHOPR